MNFIVVENPTDDGYDWESLEKDYLNPEITVRQLCDRNGISQSKYYKSIKKKLVEKTGVPYKVSSFGGGVKKYEHIYENPLTGNYRILKSVNGMSKHFGTYKSLEIAIEVRDLLIECDWDERVYLKEIVPQYHPKYIDEHYEEFEKDYIGGRMTSKELMKKYDLSYYSYYSLSSSIKLKHGLTRKPQKVIA